MKVRTRLAHPAIVDLNLLPRELRPRDVPAWSLAAAAGFVALLGVIALFSVQAQRSQQRADAVLEQATQAEASLHGLQVDIAKERAQRIELNDTVAKIDAIKAQRALFQAGARPLDQDLARLADPALLPAGARLTAVTADAAGFRVDGLAAGPLDAIAYAEELVGRGGFASARLTSFAPAAAAGGAFTLEVGR